MCLSSITSTEPHSGKGYKIYMIFLQDGVKYYQALQKATIADNEWKDAEGKEIELPTRKDGTYKAGFHILLDVEDAKAHMFPFKDWVVVEVEYENAILGKEACPLWVYKKTKKAYVDCAVAQRMRIIREVCVYHNSNWPNGEWKDVDGDK